MESPYAKARFLIYNCWQTLGDHGGIIAGSVLLDHAMTELEAAEKIKVMKVRYEDFDKAYPSFTNPGKKTRFVSIPNNPDWWR